MLWTPARINRYHLTTAEIVYHLPDHPAVLQTYLWQDFDVAPAFPVLTSFLEFWERNLDGRLHSVTVGTKTLLGPSELCNADHHAVLH